MHTYGKCVATDIPCLMEAKGRSKQKQPGLKLVEHFWFIAAIHKNKVQKVLHKLDKFAKADISSSHAGQEQEQARAAHLDACGDKACSLDQLHDNNVSQSVCCCVAAAENACNQLRV